MRLRAVLDHLDVVAARDLQNRPQVGRLAIHMDGNDGPRPRGDGTLEERRIERVELRIDVHQDGRGARQLNGGHGRDGGVRHGDDFVAGTDAARRERDMERFGPASDADPMIDTDEARELPFERGGFASEDVPAVRQHLADGGVDLGAMREVLRERVAAEDHAHLPAGEGFGSLA